MVNNLKDAVMRPLEKTGMYTSLFLIIHSLQDGVLMGRGIDGPL